MSAGLAVSDVVNVQVTLSPLPVTSRNFGALLVLGSSAVIATSESLRLYSSATQLSNDFAVNTPEYLAGALFFSQSPIPSTLYVGRWNSVASGGTETLPAAIQRLAAASGDWYGVVVAVPAPADSDILSAAQVIEATGSGQPRILLATTQEAAALVGSSTSDLAATIQAAGLKRTCVTYSSSSPYAAASLFGRIATVDYTGINTSITLMFKQLPGVVAETLSETQAAALAAKACNVFVNYQAGAAILQHGQMASGDYIDERVGMDWQQNALQVQGFNILYGANKIPQTDAGMNVLAAGYEVICDQAVTNGLVAPGIWTGPNVGSLVTGQMLTKGYYVYTPPVSTQSLADRGARKAVTCQIAQKLAGAVHQASCLVQVVR